MNTIILPQPSYSPALAPADILLFPKLKSTLKDDDFRWFKRVRRSWKRRTRTVSRTDNSFGSGASMHEGGTWKAIRLTQLQACPKRIRKKSSKTFWTIMNTTEKVLLLQQVNKLIHQQKYKLWVHLYKAVNQVGDDLQNWFYAHLNILGAPVRVKILSHVRFPRQ
jgi:hypothetical protein